MTPRQRTSRAAAALTPALQAGRAALLLVIALAVPVGVTHAQEWLPDAVIVVTTPQVGVMEDASVEVIIPTGMDFPLTLDWGDGTSDYVDHHGALTQQFTHAYLTAGVKVLELLLEDPFENETYLIDTDVIVVGSSAELDVYPTVVDVDETVTAEVTAGDTGGRLSWGDGAFELLAGGDETFTHAYGASGTYLVELSGPAGELRAATTVSVAAAPLAFDVQPTAEVGEEVVATLEGLVANAPTGARLAWGDGGIDVVLDDGPITHTYLRPGTYVVRLETLPDSRLLALHTITVDAGGSLDLPDDALLLGATRIAGRGLAPGMTYELKLGDGTTVVRSADALGGIAVEHTYTTALLRFDVDLTLVEGGQRTPIDAGRIDLRLPAAGETLRVTQAAIPGMAGLRLTVSADGLLPGVEYQVTGPAFGTATVTRAAPEAGSATVDVYAEGPVDIALDAVLEVATGGFQTVRRAETTFLASWIRDETLTVTGPYERVLDTDVLVVTAARLQAGFGYDIVVNGDRERPYRLNPAQSAALAVPGTWQVDLPLVVLGPDVTLELFARLPTGDGIQLDLRATAAVSATVPSGSLALPEPVVPYAVAGPGPDEGFTPTLREGAGAKAPASDIAASAAAAAAASSLAKRKARRRRAAPVHERQYADAYMDYEPGPEDTPPEQACPRAPDPTHYNGTCCPLTASATCRSRAPSRRRRPSRRSRRSSAYRDGRGGGLGRSVRRPAGSSRRRSTSRKETGSRERTERR